MNDLTFRAAARADIPLISDFRLEQLSRGGTVFVPDITAELTAFFEDCFDRGVQTAKLGATPAGKSLYEHAGYAEDELFTLIKPLEAPRAL